MGHPHADKLTVGQQVPPETAANVRFVRMADPLRAGLRQWPRLSMIGAVIDQMGATLPTERTIGAVTGIGQPFSVTLRPP